MNQLLFTVEEENLICAFDTSSRDALIGGIRDALPEFDGDGPEMREIAEGALRKLDAMTDTEFSETIFSPAYHDDESEV
jgi:hypothetical protein